eukprot:scaffold20335_cov20-Tisochrysis_lutea.AAC.1
MQLLRWGEKDEPSFKPILSYGQASGFCYGFNCTTVDLSSKSEGLFFRNVDSASAMIRRVCNVTMFFGGFVFTCTCCWHVMTYDGNLPFKCQDGYSQRGSAEQ